MFLFKKIVAPFFFPLSICLEILFLGLFFLWFTRRQKAGKIIVSSGILILTVISYNAFSNMLLRPLESKYPPVIDVSGLTSIKWIVVLGGGTSSDPKLPVTDHLSSASLVRLVEGIRIHKKLSKSKLVLSGGGAFNSVPEGKVMAEVAMELGLDDKELVLELKSNDSKDQAKFIYNIVGKDKFILVTTASHMPRSVALFKTNGMRPIPSPIGHRVKEIQRLSPAIFFPRAEGIDKMEQVFYEYLGITWAGLRDQI